MKVVKILILTVFVFSIISCKSNRTVAQTEQTQRIAAIPFIDTFETESVNEEEAIFAITEEMPLFDGKPANEAFTDYVNKNLILSQQMAKMSGRVFVQFIIETDGSVSNAKIIRGVNPLLDAEALRVIRSSSAKWTPAKQRGKAVRLQYVHIVEFKSN